MYEVSCHNEFLIACGMRSGAKGRRNAHFIRFVCVNDDDDCEYDEIMGVHSTQDRCRCVMMVVVSYKRESRTERIIEKEK